MTDGPAEKGDAPEAVAEIQEKKTIILFSDGTGNSSGKQHKTNVWRMYQTVDLGVPMKRGEGLQIGRYDNGVGNSAFRLIAMLQGIFGWGLKRNIISLYLFLCRNFREGDRICLFGFSRGAFTVRVLADLIDKQGIIPRDRGGELDYLVRDAYRAYRRKKRPRMVPMRWLVPLLKLLASGTRDLWRLIRLRQHYDPAANPRAPIAFVGVWDTVDAYGGPILEIVRAVDDWIMPISFADSKLPGCVETARHAIALDDERDSFRPQPWDETGQSRERLQQVWFAGMHSDVGGGYPDDSLSYVSFVWMLDEAKACAGLRFRADREGDARRQADSFGPIHDSRAGLGGYYRYQPRKISALMWPASKGFESLVDPEKPDRQGMRRPALVHSSVFRRILSGTDAYAPLAISTGFEIVEDAANPELARFASHRDRFANRPWQTAHDLRQNGTWDRVWWRRLTYFLIVLLSIALALSPLLIRWINVTAVGVGADLVRIPLTLIEGLGLRVFDWWLDAFVKCPWIPLALSVSIVILFKVSAALEKSLRATCRENWCVPRPVGRGAPAAPPVSLAYRFRTNAVYQWILWVIRWQLLPSGFGIAMLILIAGAFLSILTIVRLTWSEQDDLFCPRAPWAETGGNPVFVMATDQPCNRSPARVVLGRTYSVTLFVPPGAGWRDGPIAANPDRGIAADGLIYGQAGRFFAGMARLPNANWMQPLVHIIPGAGRNGATRTQPLALRFDPARCLYVGRFTAQRSGLVAIAVNDVVPIWPLPHDLFYRARLLRAGGAWTPLNGGAAVVRIDRAHPRGDPRASLPARASCARWR